MAFQISEMNCDPNTAYEFGAFRLIPSERQPLRDDQSVTLPPKAFETLVILVQKVGHAVKKEDLILMLWPDAFVEESNLNHYISVLRKALSDGANGERYIETVPKYGYRFTADVRALRDETSTLLVRRHTRTQLILKEERTETHKRVDHTPESEAKPDSAFIWSPSRAVVATLVASVVVIASLGVAYFGYFRRIQSQSAKAASFNPPVPRSASENPAARSTELPGRPQADLPGCSFPEKSYLG